MSHFASVWMQIITLIRAFAPSIRRIISYIVNLLLAWWPTTICELVRFEIILAWLFEIKLDFCRNEKWPDYKFAIINYCFIPHVDPFETQNRYSSLSSSERQHMHKSLIQLQSCRGRRCTLPRVSTTIAQNLPPQPRPRKIEQSSMKTAFSTFSAIGRNKVFIYLFFA